MTTLTIQNPISKVNHEVTFKKPNHSQGKLVILLDGKSIGKINKASKAIFCDKKLVYDAVKENINIIIK